MLSLALKLCHTVQGHIPKYKKTWTKKTAWRWDSVLKLAQRLGVNISVDGKKKKKKSNVTVCKDERKNKRNWGKQSQSDLRGCCLTKSNNKKKKLSSLATQPLNEMELWSYKVPLNKYWGQAEQCFLDKTADIDPKLKPIYPIGSQLSRESHLTLNSLLLVCHDLVWRGDQNVYNNFSISEPMKLWSYVGAGASTRSVDWERWNHR